MSMDDDSHVVAVSPRHAVRVSPEYAAFILRAPSDDFVVRTISHREINGAPLMTAEIVIAGKDTRHYHPLTEKYPLHFRKTYFPIRMHGDPKDEYERLAEASELLDIPPPLGYSPRRFRACMIPGESYLRHSPFESEPPSRNIEVAHKLPRAMAIGLWHCVTSALRQLQALHEGGMAHGDAELHNFVVCSSPVEIIPIDFEGARHRASMTEEAWAARCQADLDPLLREAIFLLCALGPQPGPIAELAWRSIDRLVDQPHRFKREIGRQLRL